MRARPREGERVCSTYEWKQDGSDEKPAQAHPPTLPWRSAQTTRNERATLRAGGAAVAQRDVAEAGDAQRSRERSRKHGAFRPVRRVRYTSTLMDAFAAARWYAVRPAASTKPATYRCPLCGERLPALAEHLLVLPEGDPARRRHAHTACVIRARGAGRLPLSEEVEPRRRGWLSRLLRREPT
jgi:hypothetical protein